MAGPHQVVRCIVQGTALATGEARVKNIENVYDWFRVASGGTQNKTNIKNALKTSILTPLGNCLSVSYVKNTVAVRFLDDYLDPYQSFTDGINGQVAADSLPSLNNVTFQKKDGFRGKKHRGFMHFGPIAESHTTLDYLTGAALTLWATFGTAFLAGFTDSDGNVWLPFLLSAKDSNLKVPVPVIVGNQVTSYVVNSVVGRMTRRAQFHKSAA